MSSIPSSSFPKELPTPFIRSYWVRPGQLLAGCYPGDKDPAVADQKLKGLIQCGVSTIINLMEETEGDHSRQPFAGYTLRFQELARLGNNDNVSCVRFPIRDVSVPTIAEMQTMLDAIDQVLTNGQIAYVHCWGGRGRTGTVVACHLLRHKLVREGEALVALEALIGPELHLFRPTPETIAQREFVQKWKWGQ